MVLTSLLAAACATLATAAFPTSCSTGPAAQFLGLATYGPAQAYCSQNYQPPTASNVILCSATPSYTGSKITRDDASGGPSVPSLGALMPASSRTAFQTLLRQHEATLQAFCSCIAPPIQVAGNCVAGQSCGTDGVCRPTRDCNNPASCGGQSFCGKGPSGNNLFCHQDTDDAEMGYCMNDGPANQGCPDPYQDCQANADCGGSRVCIHSCCRAEPFCVDVLDYRSEVLMRMVRRGADEVDPD
ncbi:hypothetical protein DOTSEDRAFT_73225 [Dothistroma septosporum NZE10]|uniref:Uncharacterized protein n=1 Tax=Dothistroma septosporum (strain NZE10 / CBS 128990) TaxID=675120 RepID=N1PJM7_DOTSN|nr:hypothetical protein DOTSEDRAFT_73225 [Dothistroma septosporum NZE10]